MDSSQSAGMPWVCDRCGARLPVRAEHVGRECRCRGCGLLFVVTAERLAQAAGAAPGEDSSKPAGDSSDRSADHFSSAPDRTATYGVWGVDEAPLPSEIARRQPKWFPLHCQNCDTLMHATEAQVGTELVCHDCGAKRIVKAPRPESSAPPVPLVDGYELDEVTAPGPRPSALPAIVKWEEQQRKTALEQGDSSSEKPGPHRPIASGSRPTMPRVPLIQGVLPMLWTETVLVRWIVLSLGLIVVGWFASRVVMPVQGGIVQGGFAAITVVCFLAVACILGLLWMMAAAALWMSILTESSEGNQRIYNPPGIDFTDWMADFFYVAIASTVAAIPATAIAAPIAGELSWVVKAAVSACWLLFFPVALLSMLELGSPFGIFSPHLVMTLMRRPGTWLLFTLQSCLLVAAAVAAAGAMVHYSTWLALLAGPVCVAVSLIYFRLLGRLAWWMAESEERRAES